MDSYKNLNDAYDRRMSNKCSTRWMNAGIVDEPLFYYPSIEIVSELGPHRFVLSRFEVKRLMGEKYNIIGNINKDKYDNFPYGTAPDDPIRVFFSKFGDEVEKELNTVK